MSEKVLAAFRVEHREQLEGIRCYLESDSGKGDDARRKLDEAFRLAHSLNGGARVCGLSEIESLGHEMESLLSQVRQGVVELDQAARESIRSALDRIEDSMVALARQPVPNSPPDEGKRPDASMQAAQDTQPAGERETLNLSPERVSSSGMEAQPRPTLEPQVLRLRPESLDRILSLSNELVLESANTMRLRDELADIESRLKQWRREWSITEKTLSSALRRNSVDHELNRLNQFHEFAEKHISELTRQVSRIRFSHARRASTTELVSRQIQRQVTDARMISAQFVFEGFRRMLSDLGRDEHKEIDLHLSGLDVLADRVVLERLRDPMMHLLRNAVVHGIETPEERERCGKNRVGLVAADVRILGNRLAIVIQDDGRGINYTEVERIGRQLGRLDTVEGQAQRSVLERLLFDAGFTTRPAADRLAGRGIGLSVVEEAAIRLQGSVRFVPREEGTGTAIEINVPLTMSTHRLLTVASNGRTLGIPVHAVERLLHVSAKKVEAFQGASVIVMEGEPVPVCGIEQLTNSHSEAPCPSVAPDPMHIVILRTPTQRLAVRVDHFIDERHVMIKDIHGPARKIEQFSGAFLLESGEVGLVINPAHLGEPVPQRGGEPLEDATGPTPVEPVVLIVDDSFTTRTLEKSILEANGYQVRTAVDGVDALRRLQSERVDLIVTDIQMPNMDGFELLENLKKDSRLSAIPVVLVTSLAQVEHREKGLSLGAEAYIVKRKFDHESLLGTIRQLVGDPPRSPHRMDLSTLSGPKR